MDIKNLVIVGASGFGREVLQWAKHCNAHYEQWIIKGFIDDNIFALDEKKCDISVLNSIINYGK